MKKTEIIVDCVTGNKLVCDCLVDERSSAYFIETFLMELEEDGEVIVDNLPKYDM